MKLHSLFWVNVILNHIDGRSVLPRYEGSYMTYRPEIGTGKIILNKKSIKYPFAICIGEWQYKINIGVNFIEDKANNW